MGTAGNILTGPVQLFSGEAEALETGVTTEVGYTEDGLTLGYNETIVDLDVDEEIFTVGAVRTGVEMTISFQIAEATLANFLLAYGLPATAYDDTTKELSIDPTSKVEFKSLKGTGEAPEGGTRTYFFPKIAFRGQRQSAIRKGSKILIPVEAKVYKPSTGAPATYTDVAAPAG